MSYIFDADLLAAKLAAVLVANPSLAANQEAGEGPSSPYDWDWEPPSESDFQTPSSAPSTVSKAATPRPSCWAPPRPPTPFAPPRSLAQLLSEGPSTRYSDRESFVLSADGDVEDGGLSDLSVDGSFVFRRPLRRKLSCKAKAAALARRLKYLVVLAKDEIKIAVDNCKRRRRRRSGWF
ncbi:hypothetical protein F5Y17DRAFT_477682 [Xylariaceae sp. FL0594]|nr:hypothetical protein F5Y17DRAFT_477682 [Xylariaceae sp. FL0594]